MDNYNGWTNHSTWNFFTVISNNEYYYRELLDCSGTDDIKALSIELMFKEDDINYQEILEAIKE